MNPKHSSWLVECNAWGSNMASNNELGISHICVLEEGSWLYCGCPLTETKTHKRSTNKHVTDMSLQACDAYEAFGFVGYLKLSKSSTHRNKHNAFFNT